MKKLACLILIFILLMIFAGASFAATADTPDSQVPAGPNVNILTYTSPPTNITGGVLGAATDVNLNEEVPKAEVLPKTGGIPEETFYMVGALIIIVALIVSRKAKVAAKR